MKFVNTAVILSSLFAIFKNIIAGPICGVDFKLVQCTTSRKWIQQALERSNRERINHRVLPLKLNEELIQIAQYWANELATKYKKYVHTTAIDKYKNSNCGDSIYSRTPPMDLGMDGTIPIRFWYHEILDYDFKSGNSKNGKAIQHFTQTVWKATTDFGIAYASDEKGLTFVVAMYFPSGNYYEEFTDNVLVGSRDMVSEDQPTADAKKAMFQY